MCDARLKDGSRVNVVIPPVAITSAMNTGAVAVDGCIVTTSGLSPTAATTPALTAAVFTPSLIRMAPRLLAPAGRAVLMATVPLVPIDTRLVVPGVVWSIPTLPTTAEPAARNTVGELSICVRNAPFTVTDNGLFVPVVYVGAAVVAAAETALLGLIATTIAGSAASAAVLAALMVAVLVPSVIFVGRI